MSERFGELDRGQRSTTEEGFDSDGGDAIGNRDIRKCGAALERTVGNGGKPFGEGDVDECLAEAERAVSDRKHGVGDGDLLDRGAEEECASADGLHSILNDDVGEIFAFFADEFGNGLAAEDDLRDGFRVQKIIGG